jgi:5'(3')-deoxyribonucleotidase
MIIGLDFDGTINNMLETWIDWLNQRHGTTVKIEDVVEWELTKVFPTVSKKDLFAPLSDPDYWSAVTFKPNAVKVIKKLIDEGHEIYIVTSSHYRTLPPKIDKCLLAYLPFIKKENIIITYNKALINCDVLLDDAEHNLINFKGIKVLFDAPYNKKSTVADFRITSWEDFYELVTELKIVGIGESNDK